MCVCVCAFLCEFESLRMRFGEREREKLRGRGWEMVREIMYGIIIIHVYRVLLRLAVHQLTGVALLFVTYKTDFNLKM